MKQIIIRINEDKGAGIKETVSINIGSELDTVSAIGYIEIAKQKIINKHTKGTFDGFAILEKE